MYSASLLGINPPSCSDSGSYVSSIDLQYRLINHWSMDEAALPNVDSVGGKNLTLVPATTGMAITTGKNGNASVCSETGTQKGLESAYTNIVPDGSSFTVGFWTYTDTQEIVAPLVGELLATGSFNATTARWTVRANSSVPSTYGFNVSNGGSFSVPAVEVTSVPTGKWMYVVARYYNTNKLMSLSIRAADGSYTAFNAVISTVTMANGSSYGLRLHGAGPSNGSAYRGKLDEISIWSRVISERESNALFNAGAGRFYPFT